MSQDHPAVVHTVLHFPIQRVWQALTDPADIARYMFGARVTSDWVEGSPIVWEGEFKGKLFKDTGQVLTAKPPHLLRYTHRSGQREHTVTVELREVAGTTHLQLTQTNNADETARRRSENNWTAMLDGLKVWLGEAPVHS